MKTLANLNAKALRHSKVDLTWDADDDKRAKVTRRSLTHKEIDTTDFGVYIASSDSESESCHQNDMSKKRLRNLLLGEQNENANTQLDEKVVGNGRMEITFTPAVDAGHSGETEAIENTLERYKRKRLKRYQYNSVTKFPAWQPRTSGSFATSQSPHASAGTSISDEQHFDMTAVVRREKFMKRKRKGSQTAIEGVQGSFAMNVSDSRFSAVRDDPQYAVDPSSSR